MTDVLKATDSDKIKYHSSTYYDVTVSNSDATTTKLVQSKSHFYHVTCTCISCVDLVKHTRAMKTQLFILLVPCSLCPHLLTLHSTTAISDPSFRFVFAYRDITVEFLRVASPARVATRATCCSPSFFMSVTVSVSCSLSLSFFLSRRLSFSVSLLLSIFLSSPFVFLRVSPFSGRLSFRLSFFPRRLLSSFSHLPTNDRMPLVCDVSTVYVLLVARRPETSHSVAPFGRSVLVTPTPDAAAFSLPRRVSSSCLSSLSPAFSLALFHVPSSLLARVRSFFPSRSRTSISLPFRSRRRFLGSRCRLLYRLLMPWSVPSCSRRARSRDERLKVWEKPTRLVRVWISDETNDDAQTACVSLFVKITSVSIYDCNNEQWGTHYSSLFDSLYFSQSILHKLLQTYQKKIFVIYIFYLLQLKKHIINLWN